MREQDDLFAAQLRADVRAVLQIVAAGCGFGVTGPDPDPAVDASFALEAVTGR